MTPGSQEGRSARLWQVTSGKQAPETVERLLRSLPGWFGVESSIIDYLTRAQELPTYLASPASELAVPVTERGPAGVLLAARHFPLSAEIYLMAVDPALHRRGAGRALVEALEDDLVAEGVEFLQVKPSGRRIRAPDTVARGSSTRAWTSGRWRRSTTCGPATPA